VISPELIAAYAPDRRRYRPAQCPGWIDELDLTVGPAHVRMGTRALSEAQWLTPDHLDDSERALRRRLLTEQRPHVFACHPRAEAAAAEAATLVERWLAELGGETHQSNESHPLARAGAAVQDDLCLMVRHDGAWHLEAGVLCFPSMWSLAEKMGRASAGVHAPVAHYAEELSDKVDTFFDRLVPGKLVRRRNLSLWPACLLWVPTPTIDPVLWDPRPADTSPMLWLRSERQTLRRLPGSGAILFTIRVQMAPLSVLSLRPDRAGDLAGWLRSPAGQSRRDQLGSLVSHDLAWLDWVARAGRP
jgi:hypothetical protein